eukprot:5146565-Pyramimonas_sp.AAC.1
MANVRALLSYTLRDQCLPYPTRPSAEQNKELYAAEGSILLLRGWRQEEEEERGGVSNEDGGNIEW